MRRIVPFLFVTMILSAQDAPHPKSTPHHLAMKANEGTWDAVVKMYLAPGKPPMVTMGKDGSFKKLMKMEYTRRKGTPLGV